MVEEFESVETIKEELETIQTSYIPPSKEEARWMFDYERLYWEIRAKLMGGWITQDKMNNYLIVRPKGVNPLLNTTGIEQTMALINAFVSKIQGLTIVDEERILTLCKDLYIKLARFYYTNMEYFDLDPEKGSIVLRIIVNLFEANLRKSLAGMSMRIIGQTERIIETRAEPKKRFGII